MNNNLLDPTPQLPLEEQVALPAAVRASFWAANRRRPAFLILLVSALLGFLLWLPGAARAAFWTALNAQRGLIALLLIFAMVTLSLVWNAGQRLDARIFMLFNTRSYPKWLDGLMWLATQLGNMVTAFILALILFILNQRSMAIEVILGTLTLWIMVEIIKALSNRPRPFLALDKARVIGWKERGHSFPSGHTTQIFFIVTLLVQHYPLTGAATLGLYAVATLVGVTRMYVGAHYPRDVVAGVVLGSVWGLLAILVEPYWRLFNL